MATSSSALRQLAERLTTVERKVRAQGSTSQLAHSSIEDGAVQAYSRDGTQVMVIGKQWDGTYAPTALNGPIPPTPSAPSVQDATEGLVVGWDGSFAGGLIPAPMDFLRVDAHVGTASDFIPDHNNRMASFLAPQGGYATIGLPAGDYFVKLVCWTFAGKVSEASEVVAGEAFPSGAPTTDGLAPASSPEAEVIGAYETIVVRWIPIVNADPVRYQVHISTTDDFTPDSTTLVDTVQGGQFSIKALPGVAPVDPNDPDPRKLQYDTVYYVKIVAEDDDGEAAPGVQDSDTIFRVQGGSIGFETIVGANILGGTITGDLLASTMVLSTEFWTALDGQRAGFTPDGFFAYKPDDSLMLKIPTDGTDALYDGELVVRGATILGGMSIQSDENELTADSAMTLMRGIVSPTASPQMSVSYDFVTPSTASLTSTQKTNTDPNWGLGAAFDLVASQVSCIEWRSALGFWSIFQVRSNGTREWYINPDGTPHDLTGTGIYYSDFKDWEVWSATEILSSSTPSQNGHYLMFRFMPSGDDYWVSCPTGIYRYSRQNGIAPPVIGNNGQSMFVAEVPTIITPQTHLRIRYYVPVLDNGAMPAPTTTYESTTGFSSGVSLAALRYHPSGFDIPGGARYMAAERGSLNNTKMLVTSGTNNDSIFPSGSGNNWASANNQAHYFEAPASNRRGCDWDGTNFWTLCGDGRLYKHTNNFWDPAVTSSTVWGQTTFRDGDSGGTGTHETTPGAAKSMTWKRRSNITFVSPDVPDNGGADDPDRIRFYAGRGSSQPANSAMWQQYEGTGSTVISSLATSGTNPPTVNSFPSANPAVIKSDDGGLQIKGDSTIRATSFQVGPAGGSSKELLAPGPKWLGYLSSAPSIPAGDTLTTLTGWSALESDGITLSSGIFTVSKDGLYQISGQLWWGAFASSTGTRLTQVRKNNAPAATIASVTLDAKASGAPALAQWGKAFRLVAGDQVLVWFSWLGTSAATANRVPTASSQDISFFQMRWIEP